jgi:tetratricopeptide (TPR) repeat protein
MTKIPDVSADVWKTLYAEAAAFAALKPWDHFDDGMLFGVPDPATGRMGYACVLGALGEMRALCVYRGAEGFDVHRRMSKGEFNRRPMDIIAVHDCLMAEFADREELAKPDLAVIRTLGLRLRGPQNWPLFRSHLPGCAPWHLSESEAVYLAVALRRARDAAARVIDGRLNLTEKPGQVFCYAREEDAAEPEAETHWEPEPLHRPQPPAPFSLDAGMLSRLKNAALKADGVWEADVSRLPSALTDRDRPYFANNSVVVHQASYFILHSNISTPETAAPQALGEALLEAIEKSGLLPAEIQLRDEALAACLAPLGKAFGIKLKPGKLKAVRQVQREYEQYMRTGKLPGLNSPPAAEGSRSSSRPKTASLRAMEKTLFDLSRAIREQEFESDEELDAWLEDIVSDQDLKKAPPQSALDVAQCVMYEAWETEDPDRRMELTRRALAISPNCADAYNLLGEEDAGSAEEALDLYHRGVAAGARALGAEFFKANAGHFWGMLETRPYMRCRAGLAGTLWELQCHDEALGHYHEMLRLNPGDNQGIRYIVLGCLGDLGRFDEMEKFMRGAYENDCAADWLYTKALLAFHREGASAQAVSTLSEAMKWSKHAPDYLTGKKSIPRRLPDRITVGGEDEGYCYASRFRAAWKKVPGALAWLKSEAEKAAPPSAGRNASCPCGSGKKFKKCCGPAAA